MKPTLFVLAAGMGSRYGGLKQLDGLGPHGETIMDYSIYDAIHSGFGKVVFVQASSGLIYVYCGLDSISVKVGDSVKCGDKLGVAGVDALTEKTQINLMVYQNGKVIDPAKAPRG